MRGKIIRLPVCFVGSRPAMIMLALAPSSIAVVSSDHRGATPIPPVATGRSASSLHRSRSKQAFNALRQQTASVEIPIAVDARPRHTSRGFLLWRFAYAGPRCSPRHHHGAGIRKPSQKQSFTVGDSSALNRCLQRSLRSASALLLCKFQGAVRKRAGVASECRHIDRLRPPVGHVMIDLAATH